MRFPGLILLAGWLSLLPAGAQLTAAAPTLPLAYAGTGPSETAIFTSQNRWQVQWSGSPSSVTIEDASGTVLAGAGGITGTIYMPNAGGYKVRIVPSLGQTGNWRFSITQVGAPGGTVQGDIANTYVPPDMTFVLGAGSPDAAPAPAAQPRAMGMPLPAAPNSVAATTPALPAAPLAATPPGAAAAPVAGSQMTEAQTAAIVLIRGDNAQGTGFLVKTAAGPFVITNQHVIAANPHLQITTTGGSIVKQLGLSGASDRDLAMIPIQDNNYSYLPLAANLGTSVQAGDEVITPGNSEGGGVMLTTSGQVLALGPQKIEISNPTYHGNSGGPIIAVKTGQVVGVVTEGLKVDTSDALDRASFNSGHSGITASMRYFGMRIDNVPTWEPYTWARFENETEFLREFDERSKSLDSYLNTASNDTSERGLYYLKDDRVKDANDTFNDTDAQSDVNQKIQAARTLVFALDGIADLDMDEVKHAGNFYSFDQIRARDEADYRTSLKQEISDIRDNVERVGHLARSNSR